ncbi:FtsX-like permease family protein [Angustibacter luteus]|uniref:FtsX-like permease family protein n=1 Tax=Angustibacter luteus TaxID=658456 RepID=A0ABW1JHL0_9ACTN
MNPLRLHRPSVLGRARADVRLLLLTGGVVALTSLLTAAVPPLAERTADRAVAGTVRQAGAGGDVVVTVPFPDDTESAARVREPSSAAQVQQASREAQLTMPADLNAVLRPGVASVTTTELHVLGGGPGRYARLAYVVGRDGAPAVTWTSGGPPRASVPPAQATAKVPDGDPWPVQVALSQAAATALGLRTGDTFAAEDERYRRVEARVSGIYSPTDPAADAWQAAPRLLHPSTGVTEKVVRTSAAALVSAESLPDLRLAVPFDDLDRRVVFTPQPDRLRYDQSEALVRDVVALKASSAVDANGTPTMWWDSLLDRVLLDARSQVVAARAQATVLLVGLLAGAALLLVLAAQLLTRRRAAALAVARERGAGLVAIGAELLVESAAVAVVGAGVGVLAARLLVGGASWPWTLPVLAVAALAGPVLGVLVVSRAGGGRRVPANRSARRTAARAKVARRILLEATVALVAVAALAALRQRGVLGGGDEPDLLAASAPTWFAVLGALVVLRLLPPVAAFVLARSRRSPRAVPLFAAAGAVRTATRALPMLLVTVTAAQLTVCVALAATEQHGQSAGAWREVGADAQLQTDPDRGVGQLAQRVAGAPGVTAAVAARVADGVPAASGQTAARVRLVVVDAAAFAKLLAATPLPDAPQLERLAPGATTGTPALLRGGDPALREGLRIGWDDARLPLHVVGTAPAIGSGEDPVVVVDAAAFAATGAAADPGTVWAVGPGAVRALEAAAHGAAAPGSAGPGGTVVRRDDVLEARRDAPLAAALRHLAIASAALLLLFGVLGVVLAAAVAAPARNESLGRLRAMGLRPGQVGRVLGGELVPPVAVGVVAGLVLGLGSAAVMFGSLALQRVTGQTGPPDVVLPWWTVLLAAALVVAALVVAQVESSQLRRTSLARLLRGGDRGLD